MSLCKRRATRASRVPLWAVVLMEFGGAVAEVGWVALSGFITLAILHNATEAGSRMYPALPLRAAACYIALALLLRVYPRGRSALVRSDLQLPMSLVLLLFVSIALLGLPSLQQREAASLVVWLLLTVAGVIVLRQISRQIGRSLIPADALLRRAILVGSGPAAVQLVEIQHTRRTPEYTFLGFFDDRHLSRGGTPPGGLPFLGRIDDLIDFIEDHEDIEVFIALPWTAGERITSILERLRFLPATVRLTPDPAMSVLALAEGTNADSVRMPTMMKPPFSRTEQVLKRSFDLIGSSLLILCIAPFLLAFALLIKLDSPGPIFFIQVRSGQFGRKFNIIKFRSLHVAEADTEADKLVGKGDTRVTRLGRFIRKYSIDELPQLFNVVCGTLSLVGPRPHAPKAKADGKLYAEVVPDYAIRYRAKPGMTGWAQINGFRGETDTEEKLVKRVEYDFDYIRRWSFLFDLIILFRTVPAVLFPPKTNV